MAQDAANLMASDFAKASRNLQFLDLPGPFFVAGAGRSQPYGFSFAKASQNLQLLDLRDAFCLAGAGRGQPYDHFSWQALYGSTNRKEKLSKEV